MKILLFCHLGQIREYAEYVNSFKKLKSLQTVFLTMGQEEYELAQEVATFDEVKDILPTQGQLETAEEEPALAADSLRKLEQRLGSNFVNRDILTDRFFRAQPRLDIDPGKLPLVWTGTRTKQFMFLVYRRLEQEIHGFSPDFMFVEPSFAPTRMAWRLAHEKGIPAGGFMSVRFWPERMYLETGLGYDWLKARIAYREMPEKPMSDAESAQVQKRLKTILEEKTKPAYLKTEHARGAPDILKRLHPGRLFTGLYPWLGKRAGTYTNHPQVLPGEVFSPVAKYLRYRNGEVAKRYLSKTQIPFDRIRKKKYVIYFLHVQPEITVEGMAFNYQDQVNTLRNVLACLPANMELVVKEHSPMLGFRPMAIYDQLARMPGLVFAETHEDSHSLITHASVVVTLTGTVALEAVLYGVPAIVMGSIYFDGFNGIYKAADLSELRNYLSDPENLPGATRADAVRALGSMLRASRPGKPPRVDVTLEGIDLESAKMMMLELEEMGREHTDGR
jgi:hypothetical protein